MSQGLGYSHILALEFFAMVGIAVAIVVETAVSMHLYPAGAKLRFDAPVWTWTETMLLLLASASLPLVVQAAVLARRRKNRSQRYLPDLLRTLGLAVLAPVVAWITIVANFIVVMNAFD